MLFFFKEKQQIQMPEVYLVKEKYLNYFYLCFVDTGFSLGYLNVQVGFEIHSQYM